jgi:hypothetical protein
MFEARFLTEIPLSNKIKKKWFFVWTNMYWECQNKKNYKNQCQLFTK